jgi:hypothetical protein
MYKIIKELIPKEIAEFNTAYFLLKRQVFQTFLNYRYISPYELVWGTWKDPQVLNTYSCYGDIAMETLLHMTQSKIEKALKIKLIPTYSFARIYKKGDILKRHKDRFSCELSGTMFLGGTPWDIFLDPTGKIGKKGIKISQNPGDILIYSGCELEHWREPFMGEYCVQVFTHYNKADSKGAQENKFDRRPHLGLPTWFKK